jgi:hypothetical protein
MIAAMVHGKVGMVCDLHNGKKLFGSARVCQWV